MEINIFDSQVGDRACGDLEIDNQVGDREWCQLRYFTVRLVTQVEGELSIDSLVGAAYWSKVAKISLFWAAAPVGDEVL